MSARNLPSKFGSHGGRMPVMAMEIGGGVCIAIVFKVGRTS